MSKAITSHKGVSLSGGDRNLTYLYGISDFWSHIFENPEVVHDVLEANTYMMAEAYNKFLQLTSTLSLDTIQETANSQVKLILLDDSLKVEGSVSTYYLPANLVSAGYLMNRPLLPTETLQEDVHYDIDVEAGTIQFSKPIEQYLLPSRVDKAGNRQYALWAANASVNEDFIYKHYGKLLNISSQTALDVYKAYVQGLYYLFTNGPNVRYLERGLNLVMGVPVSRQTERVTYKDRHTETNNWLVVTDNHSYVIPFGLEPTVEEGDIIEEGSELASWVEVKDWQRDDNWWINLTIPPEVIPNPPGGDSRAVEGSPVDYLMSNYLKRHTFLVRLKTAGVSNFNIFQNISEVVSRAKPSYTFPIYIWDVPVDTEILNLIDDDFAISTNVGDADNPIGYSIEEFRRDTSKPYRGNPVFIRSNVPMKAHDWLTRFDGTPVPIDGGDGELLLNPRLLSDGSTMVPNSMSVPTAQTPTWREVGRMDTAVENYEVNAFGGNIFRMPGTDLIADIDSYYDEWKMFQWDGSEFSLLYAGAQARDAIYAFPVSSTKIGVVEYIADGDYRLRSVDWDGSQWVDNTTDTEWAVPDQIVNREWTHLEDGILVHWANYQENIYTGWYNETTSSWESAATLTISGRSIDQVIPAGPSRIAVYFDDTATMAIYSFDGSSWSAVSTEVDGPNLGRYLLGASRDNILAYAGYSSGIDVHSLKWNGSSWDVLPVTSITDPALIGGLEGIGGVAVGDRILLSLRYLVAFDLTDEGAVQVGDTVSGEYYDSDKNILEWDADTYIYTTSSTLIARDLVNPGEFYESADLIRVSQFHGSSTGIELTTEGWADPSYTSLLLTEEIKAGSTYDFYVGIWNTPTSDVAFTANLSLNVSDVEDTSIHTQNIPLGSRAPIAGSFTASESGSLYLNFKSPATQSSGLEARITSMSLKEQGGPNYETNHGAVAMQAVYEKGSYYEAWMNALGTRVNPSSTFNRGDVNYRSREASEGIGTGMYTTIPSSNVYLESGGNGLDDLRVDDGMLVPLYSTRESDLLSKLSSVGITLSELPTKFAVIPDSSSIKEFYDEFLLRNRDLIADDEPDTDVYDTEYLHAAASEEHRRVRAIGIENVHADDYLVVLGSYEDVYSVYLRSHSNVRMAPYFEYDRSPENLKITVNATGLSRGGLALDSRAFLTRGTLDDQYTDELTTLPVTLDRDDNLGNTLISEKGYV